MKHGEIRWYRFSSPDKRRPVLILTRDSAIPHLGEVTIAPITSTIRGIPSEVILSPADGMPRECAVNLDHVQTVSRRPGRVDGDKDFVEANGRSPRRPAIRLAIGAALGGRLISNGL